MSSFHHCKVYQAFISVDPSLHVRKDACGLVHNVRVRSDSLGLLRLTMCHLLFIPLVQVFMSYLTKEKVNQSLFDFLKFHGKVS